MTRAAGCIAFAVTERACCGVSVGRGLFGCAGASCGLVACVGEEIVGSFVSPWYANDAGDGTVRRNSPC